MITLKPIITLCASILFGIAAHSQTISDLDKKNGFKDFKMGDFYSKWKNDIRYKGTMKNGSNIKVYTYIGVCCRQAFSYDLDSIELGFLDGRLTVIYLTTKQFQEAGYDTDRGIYTRWNGTKDFDKLKEALISYFGNYDSVEEAGNSGDISYYWVGKKVILELTYDYLSIDKGDKCRIMVGRIDQKMKKSGF